MNERSPNLRIPDPKTPKKWEEPKSRDTGRWVVASTIVIVALVASGLFIAKAIREEDTDSSKNDSISTESSVSVEEEKVGDNDEVPIPDGKGEDEEDDGIVWGNWRTSKDHFVITIPTNWEILQADGGRTSLVTILDNDGLRRLMIFIGSARAEDNQLMSLDEWRLTIADIPGTEACLNRTLGGISMPCYKEDGKEVFYGSFGDGLYTRVTTSQNEETAEVIGEILHSLRYSPSNQDLEGTKVIP